MADLIVNKPIGSQRIPVRLVDRGDGTYAELITTSAQPYTPFSASETIAVTPTVTASSAYVSGNCIGGLMVLARASRNLRGGCVLLSLHIIDTSNQKPQGDLLFFSVQPNAATLKDKTATALSTDALNIVARVNVATADYVTIDSKAIATKQNLWVPLSPGQDFNIYAAFTTTSTPTFTAANAMTFVFGLQQD